MLFPWPGDPLASPESEADGRQATAREKVRSPSAKGLAILYYAQDRPLGIDPKEGDRQDPERAKAAMAVAR